MFIKKLKSFINFKLLANNHKNVPMRYYIHNIYNKIRLYENKQMNPFNTKSIQ